MFTKTVIGISTMLGASVALIALAIRDEIEAKRSAERIIEMQNQMSEINRRVNFFNQKFGEEL